MHNAETDNMYELSIGMTNYDHSIDDGLSIELLARPGKVYGYHAACNFYGKVFFKDGKFHEEVWIYNLFEDIVTADTLKELMVKANSIYGAD